ncbi:MAG: ATP-dependent helicase [Synechococcaceae cyanobacterium SM2_3_1]|nr:ATP-dependent helicase [Synechococcaceae cyanobacterium SM2_3_1]
MPRQKQLSIPWSHYQQAIFDWVKSGSGHALVNAVAGSGKTTTLKEMVSRIPVSKKIAVLAFNNHMASELRQKLPKRITVSTIHRMGMSVLIRYFRQTFQCNESKYHDLANEAIQQMLKLRLEWERDPELQDKEPIPPPQLNHPKKILARELEGTIRSFLKEVIHYLQITLTEPTPEGIKMLISHFGLESPKGTLLEWLLPWPEKILEHGRLVATENLNIGLDDLLWLPHVLNLQPKTKDWVLVDEAQDLSRAQLDLVLKLKGETGRMVFVGDEQQAIFGFAGSDAYSWERIREAILPTEFPLSITYRCPKTHANLAARIVPQLECRPEAPEGEVHVIHPASIKHQVRVGDLVLCRFTAPLISLCLKLVIQQGIQARVRGRDIGKMLAALVKDVADTFPENFRRDLRAYVEKRVKRYSEEGRESAIESLQDREAAIIACFQAFSDKCETISLFCKRLQELFDDEALQSEYVILATIHRSKGDEAERVFFLKSDCMPFLALAETRWQKQQEWNLLYVGLTRSRGSLFLVPMPMKPELLPALLEQPYGGMQLNGAPSGKPYPPKQEALSEDPATDPHLQHAVNTLHEILQKMLRELIETAQIYQVEFPELMKWVWPRLTAEFAPGQLAVVPPTPAVAQLPPLQTSQRSPVPLIRIGDVCRYRGPEGAMNVTCWGRDLQVLDIKGEVATVKTEKWIHPHEIEIHYLRKVQ